MTESKSSRQPGDKPSSDKTAQDRLFPLLWAYVRGWIVIGVAVFVTNLVAGALSEVVEWLRPLTPKSLGQFNVVLAVLVLLVVPWAIGRFTELIPRFFRKSRGQKAFEQMERRLTTELKPDEQRGYRIGLMDDPNPKLRSLAVVGASLREPGTGRELASIYLPGTPDPTRGRLRTVAYDDLTMTSWTLQDLAAYHLTLGSACPDLVDDEA